MTNFIADAELGQVVEKKQLFSFGAAPLTNLKALVFAAGGHKFSALCGFNFTTKADVEFKRFTVAFVCKIRSKFYHNATNNPSQWYIFKQISPKELHCLTKEQLLMQYGFNIDKFFDSDYFQKSITTFKSLIKKGISQYVPQYVSQHGEELASAALTCADSGTHILVKDAVKRYVNAIEESLAYLNSAQCNNKFYKLIDYDTYVENEVVAEAAKWECVVKDDVDGKFNVFEKDGNIWVASFSSKETAEAFASQYPNMKSKYLTAAKDIVGEAALAPESDTDEPVTAADEAELDKEIDEAVEEIYN